MLQRRAILAATAGQVSADLDGELVVLDLHGGVYYGLNGVGARVWQLLQAPTRLDRVVATLAAEYDVDRDRCEADVQTLVEQLVAARLVEVRDAAGP